MVSDCNHNRDYSDIDTFIKIEHVNIGDWCFFEKDGRISIGLVHIFSYINSKNFKEKSFIKSTASIQSEKAIGVLCTWYGWNTEGQLQAEHILEHKFLNIHCYRGTIRNPTYENQILKITSRLVQALNDESEEMDL